jgi:hypothetical protein
MYIITIVTLERKNANKTEQEFQFWPVNIPLLVFEFTGL